MSGSVWEILKRESVERLERWNPAPFDLLQGLLGNFGWLSHAMVKEWRKMEEQLRVTQCPFFKVNEKKLLLKLYNCSSNPWFYCRWDIVASRRKSASWSTICLQPTLRKTQRYIFHPFYFFLRKNSTHKIMYYVLYVLHACAYLRICPSKKTFSIFSSQIDVFSPFFFFKN